MGDLGSPWEELKRQLSDELTPEELRDVVFLMKDKLGSQFSALWSTDKPLDLFTFLENTFTEIESMQILKHVLAIFNYHTQFSGRSFTDIIEAYEKKTEEIEERFQIYRDVNFVGRKQEIERIKTILTSASKGVWLSGQGGMGKTTLASEVCYRLHLFHNVHIINVNLKEKTSASDVSRAILMARNEEASSSDKNILSAQAVTSVMKISETETILLLDNIEDCLQNDTEDTFAFLLKLLAVVQDKVKVMVTSRIEKNEMPSLPQNCLEEVRLLPLSPNDAMKLLRTCSRPRQLADNECATLLLFSGHSPLAIRILSRAIQNISQENIKISIEDTLRSIQRKEVMTPLLDVIKYSYDSLSNEYQKCLLQLSVFGTSSFEIDEMIFVTQLSRNDAILSLMLLNNKHLVELEQKLLVRNEKENAYFCYFLHPMVLTFLAPLEKPSDTNRKFLELMFKKIQNVEGSHNERFVEAFSIFRDRTAIIKQLFKSLQNEPKAFSIHRNPYLYKLSVFYGSPSSRLGLLLTLAKKHLESGYKTSGLYWCVVSAATCIDDGNLDKAEQYLKEIQTDIQHPAPDVNMTYVQAEYFLTKGRINNNRNQNTDSEENLLQSMRLYLQSGDISSRFSEVAMTMNALGNVNFKRRNYKQALAYHQNAVDKMKEYLLDYNNQHLTVYIFNLGTVKAQQADILRENDRGRANLLYAEALNNFNVSLDIDLKLNLQSLPNYPTKLLQRLSLYHSMGRYDEAVEDGKVAKELREKIYGPNHSLVTEAYFRLAQLLYNRSKDTSKETREIRRVSLSDAYALFIEIEKQIRRGSMLNQNCEEILNLYMDVVTALRKPKLKAVVERFCNDVRKGAMFSDSDSSSSASTPSSPSASSSSSDEGIPNCRRDSGLADSLSTPEDAEMTFQSLSFQQASTDSDVFLPFSGSENNQSFKRMSFKRRLSESD